MSYSQKWLTAHSPEQRELFSLLLKEKGIQISQKQTIGRRRDSSFLPLSFAQERLWFIDQLDGGRANYNIPAIARLSGSVKVAVLEQSLSEIVRRHESLRTTFASRDGKPFMAIAPPQPLKLKMIDLHELPATQREAEALRLATEAVMKPFDLAEGPLLRVTLLRMSEEAHVLVLNVHHIVADGWSMGVFTRELSALYEAFLNGVPSPLPELPIQYADFALWEREWLQGEVLRSQLSYWKQAVRAGLKPAPTIGGSGIPEGILHTDHPRPSVWSYRGRHHPLTLSKSLSGALRTLAQREGVTLFMTLLAAFVATLYRYSGQENIVVGSTFANRNRSELEGMIGFFANTLPLRTDLSGNPSFQELLRRVREVTLGASAHQEVPLSLLVSELQPERDLSRNPLYQVVFDLLTPEHNPAVYGYGLSSAVMETLELPGLTMTPLDVEGRCARFDLACFIWDMPEGLSGAFEYSTDLFEAATIAWLAEDFETLLRHVVAEPDVRLNVLVKRLNETERQRRIHKEKVYQETIYQKLKNVRRRSIRHQE